MKIRKVYFLILFAHVFWPAVSLAEPKIRIVQPYENQKIPYVTSSFVFGSVTPATATLRINGVPVTPYKNGGYLTMIPFEEGTFQIQAVAEDGVSVATATRKVQVGYAARSLPAKHPRIEPGSPKTRVVLRPGDLMEVSFQGAPGGTATYRVGGGEFFPMREQPGPIQGVYKGVYKIQPNDNFTGDDVVYVLRRADGRKLVQRAGAQITIQRRVVPRLIEIKERTVLLTGPGGDYGYNMLLGEGVRMEVTGEWGDFYRVVLGPLDEGWIKKVTAVELPIGTIPARSISRNIKIDASDTGTIVEIPLQYRHVHRMEELWNPYRLRLTLFGVVTDTDRIRYKSSKSIVREIAWSQNSTDTTVFEMSLKDLQWGYDIRYEGNKLVVEIRHRPILAPSKNQPLKGLRVALDAGHSKQSYGTIGPWGTPEASVNLGAAKVIQKELEKKGAEVVMVQDGTKDLSLQDRTDIAWAQRAHIFLSLHADATDDGVDPREIEGYSVHYYFPQSRPWAEEIYSLYGQISGVRDQGLWRSNLAVCRMTQMPSALIEMAFLVIPENEEKLLKPAFQQMVANTVSGALLKLINRTQP